MAVPKNRCVSKKSNKLVNIKFIKICKVGHKSVKKTAGGFLFSFNHFCKHCLQK
jgi:hypothetical protein